MKQTYRLAAVLLLLSTPAVAFATDRWTKVFVRDTLVGAGAGLLVGMMANSIERAFLVGTVAGAVFGYIDAEKGLVSKSGQDWKIAVPQIDIRPGTFHPATSPLELHATLFSWNR